MLRSLWPWTIALAGCIFEDDPEYLGPATTTDGASTSTTSASESTSTSESSTSTDDATGPSLCDPGCDPVLEICVGQSCLCRPGLTECDGECVDLHSDGDHCGRCTTSCASGHCGDETCQTPTCPGFPDICGTRCTDTASDPLNCGRCDQACATHQLCVQGECMDAVFPNCLVCPCPECGDLSCCPSTFVGAPVCLPLTQCP
jgi:hypothetical protein